MAYTYIKDFKNGVDRRRRQTTAHAGSLYELINAHLTRGGDIEKRKAFVSTYSLPSGTFGMAAIAGALYVFGSAADPGVPSGVTYQRLQAPSGSAMTGVVSVDTYNGKAYVVAEYADGNQYHFYDGSVVYDWQAGVVRSYMASNSDIATHLKNVIDDDDDFTATVSSNQITITGPVGDDFSVVLTTEDGGGNNNQSLTSSILRFPREARTEVRAQGAFSILGGSTASANKITSVKAGSTELLGSDVAWSVSNSKTAANVASEINDNTFSGLAHGYSAASEVGVVFLFSPEGQAESTNDEVVTVVVGGDVIIESGSFAIKEGTNSTGVNIIDSVTADGIELLAADVDWVTSNSATAAAVATSIRSGTGSHGYTAFSKGETVRVSKKTTTSNDGVVTLKVTTGGDVVVGGGTSSETPEPNDSSYPIGGGGTRDDDGGYWKEP